MPPMPDRSSAGCVAVLGLLALLVAAGGAWLLFGLQAKEGPGLTTVIEKPPPGPPPAEPPAPPLPSPPPPARRPPAPAPAAPVPLLPARTATAAAVERATGPSTAAADPDLLRALAEALARKVADPAYAEARRRPGIPEDPDRLPFEAEVKGARARVAAAARAPAGVAPLPVPALPAGSVRVDGRLRGEEWNGSLEVPLDGGARLLVGHDGTRLLLAAEAPGDRTEKGYDQFRAFLHAGLAPSLVNERLHLAGNGWRSVLRETTVTWTGAKAAGEEDAWKERPLTDWNVQERCEGASTLEGFRRYEAALDLEEAGIPSTAPFPLFIEIEGDPITENGKFRRRVMVGGLGAQERPVWFVLE